MEQSFEQEFLKLIRKNENLEKKIISMNIYYENKLREEYEMHQNFFSTFKKMKEELSREILKLKKENEQLSKKYNYIKKVHCNLLMLHYGKGKK